MATRLKEGMIPYTGGIGIEITDNHVINVLLRALNNLIHVNDDRELYVDLQIPDGVKPDYDFEVGVTTGRILQEDGWPQNATILNWKTTSGDYVRLIYAADDKLYYDPGTGVWIMIGTATAIDVNTKTFFPSSLQDLETGQAIIDYLQSGKHPIIKYNNTTYYLRKYEYGDNLPERYTFTSTLRPVSPTQNRDDCYRTFQIKCTANTTTVVQMTEGNTNLSQTYLHLGNQWYGLAQTVYGTKTFNTSPVVPSKSTAAGNNPTTIATEAQVYLKQDKLTAGANISIAQDGKTISATIPQALVYKGSVNGLADLPSSGQTVGDTYFVEGEDGMYSWDGTQWSYVGGSGIDVTNLFNKTIDTSDNIVQGTTNLFVTSTEKNRWNSKQDALTAGANIQISNNVISATDTTYSAGTAMELVGNTFNNTKPFDPENAGTLSQVLKKTSTGYRWANETEGFDPENAGTTGQVLKKTNTGYAWANESGGGGGGTTYTGGDGISVNNSTHVITNTKPFEPSAGGTVGQVLTKTADGYNWQTIAGGEGNVKLFSLSSLQDTTTAQAVLDWVLAGKMPIIKYNNGVNDVYYCLNFNLTNSALEFKVYMGPGIGSGYTYQVYEEIYINYSGTTVSNIQWSREELNKTWSGTQAQYNALGIYENGVVYNIIPS